MAVQIQHRRDTAANWTSTNPVLAQGEMGIETDTKYFKIGDGATIWSNLPYGGMAATSPVIGTSINTASTTFDVVNTTATTINVGGAATSLNFGASTGTFTVRNPVLSVNGANPSIRSTNTGAATIFPANVSGITIGASAIPTNVAGVLTLGVGSTSPLKFGSSTAIGTATGGAFEYDGAGVYFSPSSSVASNTAYAGRGLMDTSHYLVLGATQTLTAQLAVQPLFDAVSGLTSGTFAVAPSTTYAIEMDLFLAKSVSSTTVVISFPVNATSTTFTNWALETVTVFAAANTATAPVVSWATGTTGVPTITALSTAGTVSAGIIKLRGVIKINASTSGTGVIQPSITFAGTAPTAVTLAAGSFIKLTPIPAGQGTTDPYIGAWA